MYLTSSLVETWKGQKDHCRENTLVPERPKVQIFPDGNEVVVGGTLARKMFLKGLTMQFYWNISRWRFLIFRYLYYQILLYNYKIIQDRSHQWSTRPAGSDCRLILKFWDGRTTCAKICVGLWSASWINNEVTRYRLLFSAKTRVLKGTVDLHLYPPSVLCRPFLFSRHIKFFWENRFTHGQRG